MAKLPPEVPEASDDGLRHRLKARQALEALERNPARQELAGPPPPPDTSSSCASSLTLLLRFLLAVLIVGVLTYIMTGTPECSESRDGTVHTYFPLCRCQAGRGLSLSLPLLASRRHCVKCERNSVKASADSMFCSPCALWEETSGLDALTACHACRAGHTRQRSVVGVADSAQNGPCRACRRNTHLPHPQGACLPCPNNTHSQEGATECRSCPLGQARAGDALECTPCPANTFKPEGLLEACSPCPPDTHSAPGATACTPCSAGQARAAGGAACAPCPRNTFKPPPEAAAAAALLSSSPGQCSPCPSHSFSAVGATACECAKGATRATGGSRSVAAAGAHSRPPCVPCGAGLFKNTTGDGPCLKPRAGHKAAVARDREEAQSAWEAASALAPRREGSLLDSTVGGLVRGVAWATLSLASSLSSAFKDLLELLYTLAWGKREEFEREYNATGGGGSNGQWTAAEEHIPQAKRALPCPFQDQEAVWAFVQKQQPYLELGRARGKKEAKPILRTLSLQYHVSVCGGGGSGAARVLAHTPLLTLSPTRTFPTSLHSLIASPTSTRPVTATCASWPS